METHIVSSWITGRVRRTSYKEKSFLFMTLKTLKHSVNSDFLANIFNMKGPPFDALVMSVIVMILGLMYKSFVEDLGRRYTMANVHADGTQFKYQEYTLYSTDVTLQQSNRPSGNHSKSQRYFPTITSCMDTKRRFLCFPMA